MSKTAAELHDRYYGGDGYAYLRTAEIQAIIDDACAGMVPEGELEQMRTRAEMWERNAHASEAELAKAWEAGRDAAWRAMATCNDKTHAEELRAISKLQPPGGKAK